MVSIIVWMKRWPFFQVVMFVILSIFSLAYLLTVKPYASMLQNRVEIVTEFVVYSSTLICILYEIEYPNQLDTLNIISYTHIGFSSVNMLIAGGSMISGIPKHLKSLYLQIQSYFQNQEKTEISDIELDLEFLRNWKADREW